MNSYLAGQCGCAECRYSRRLQAERTLAMRTDRAAAEERAEGLLRDYLTPEQLKDWRQHRAFNVRGSSGSLFRVSPSNRGRHVSVIRKQGNVKGWGLGIAAWPIGLDIEADWALAMLLYLKEDENLVVRTGCHDDINLMRRRIKISSYRGRL